VRRHMNTAAPSFKGEETLEHLERPPLDWRSIRPAFCRVIRQERDGDEEDDVYVRFNMESLPKVIAKLQAVLGGEDGG
jgi:hypothetical protein